MKKLILKLMVMSVIIGTAIAEAQNQISRPLKAKPKKEVIRQPAAQRQKTATADPKQEITDDSIRAENLRNTPTHLDFELKMKLGDTKYISVDEMQMATQKLKKESRIVGIAVEEGKEIFVITSFGYNQLKYKEAPSQSPTYHLPKANQALAIVRNQNALASAFESAKKANSTGWELDLQGNDNIGTYLSFWVSSSDGQGINCWIKNQEYTMDPGNSYEALPCLTIGKIYSSDSFKSRSLDESRHLDLVFKNRSTKKTECLSAEEWVNFKQRYPIAINPSRGLLDPIGIHIKGIGQDFIVALNGNEGKYEWNLVKSDPDVPTKQQADLILSNLNAIDRITSQAFGFKFSDKNKSWCWTRSVEKSGADKNMRIWLFNPNLMT